MAKKYVLFCTCLRFSTTHLVVLKCKRMQNKTYCSAIFNYVYFICTLRFVFSHLIIYNFTLSIRLHLLTSVCFISFPLAFFLFCSIFFSLSFDFFHFHWLSFASVCLSFASVCVLLPPKSKG